MARTLPLTQQTSLHEGALQEDGSVTAPEAIPARGNRRLRRGAGAIALLAGLLLASSCGGNRNVLTEPTPPSREESSQETAQAPASDPAAEGGILSPTDGAPPAEAGAAAASGEETLGERLGRLDAQMRTALPDSLPALQAEYQRLLEEATGSGTIETGGPRRESGVDTILAEQEPIVRPSAPRDPSGNEIRLASYDSTLQLKGMRPSELRYAAASANTTPAPPAAAEPHQSKPRTRASARPAATASAEHPRTEPAAERRPSRGEASRGTAQAGAKNFVNGVAATRAGWDAEAADELPRALSVPQSTARRTLAEYSYAQSLENSGKLSQAADQYLKTSRTGSKLGDKSYISYCRVLAKSGQKERARQLLVQFIGKNPKSDQVVDARQLLQTL